MNTINVIILCVFMLLSCFILGNQGVLYFEKNARHPTDPDRCYSVMFKKQMMIGKQYRLPPCGRMECTPEYIISYATCGTIGIPKGCVEKPGNLSLAYPKCCPDIDCPESTSSEEIQMII